MEKRMEKCLSCEHQICCRAFRVPLTPQESTTHRLDLARYNRLKGPEAILESLPDGACVHLRGDGLCGIWEGRPEACREYDCEGDERIEQALSRGCFPGGAA